MVSRILAGDLKGDDVTVIAMDPGWVKTDMGGPDAQLTPEQSIAGMLSVIDGLTGEQSGKFFTWQGGEAAW
jgi:NAD(P)-dependent dehydrogenase (short-subunit alcohol dehydrogenase family)